jgi:malonyl-CoA/methylmalonyl-CoA synthetase
MQLADLFDLSLAARPDAAALDVDAPGGGATSLTFAEVDARANRMARTLAARGLIRGDRLCVHLANRLEYIDLFIACVRLGIIFVPVNVLYRERELTHIVGDASPAMVITSYDHLPLFPAGTPVVDIEELAREADAWQASDSGATEPAGGDRLGERGPREPGRIRLPLNGDDPVAIVYTSGTTGRSKGAVLSHNNFLANTASLVACWRITSEDRYLAVLPLFHVHGLANGVCCWLATGCRMRLVERFAHQTAAALFAAFRPTLFFGVPTIYVRLLDLPADAARAIGRHMRLFVSGSAPLPAHVLDAFRDRYRHTILERYGMSETLMNTSNPCAGERRAGTVGMPLPGVSARIVDDVGRLVSHDTVGEFQVRGPNVFSGYWKNPAATLAAFTTDGWFRTGDMAERSADGYVTLRGRSSDLIITGGFNVYPREIEDVLVNVPGVLEAAVVGVPDPVRGEVPVACVVAGPEFDEAVARDACARQLASFKTPRAFVRVDALPRNALGKVQRRLLPVPPLPLPAASPSSSPSPPSLSHKSPGSSA